MLTTQPKQPLAYLQLDNVLQALPEEYKDHQRICPHRDAHEDEKSQSRGQSLVAML